MSLSFKAMYGWAVVGWYLVFLIFFVIIYIFNSKPHKSKHQKKINKNYPSKIKPTELAMLMYKKIIPEVFTASILGLIYNKKILIKQANDDYILMLNEGANLNLEKDQQYVINILFDSIAHDNNLKLSVFDKYASNKNNSSEFLTNYYVWKRIAQKETFQNNFYEPKFGYNLIIVYKYITAMLVAINFIYGYHWIGAYLLILLSIMLRLFFYKTYKRTSKSNDEYHKWKGFRKSLESYSTEDVNLTSEQIFDFLIYGTVLKETKNMQNKAFGKVYGLTVKLNEIVNKCVISAELHAHREIKWK